MLMLALKFVGALVVILGVLVYKWCIPKDEP